MTTRIFFISCLILLFLGIVTSVHATVSLGGLGTGTVTSSPAGIDCPATCTAVFTQDSTVTLSATPDPGFAFDSWSGGTCKGNADCTETMDRDYNITATFNEDIDGDGISDTMERNGPNGGDANNDGVLDAVQHYVTSYRNIYGVYVTLVIPSVHRLTMVTFQENPSPIDTPQNVSFDAGFFGFTIQGITTGGSTTLTVIAHGNYEITSYYKYGPTPGDSSNHWYEFLYNGESGAQIDLNDNQARTILHLTDGSRGDDDLTANGSITDIGGPGTKWDDTEPDDTKTNVQSSGGCFVSTLINE